MVKIKDMGRNRNLKKKILEIFEKKYCSSNSVIKERVNLLNRNFTAEKIDQKWISDILYIDTLSDSWCFIDKNDFR